MSKLSATNPKSPDQAPHERATIKDRLESTIAIAMQAPSTRNTQPWLFRIDGDAIELYADRSRSLPIADPDDRELTISCGAALFYLRLSLRHLGYSPLIEVLPCRGDPDFLARVIVGQPKNPSVEEEILFSAIPWRHTNRKPYDQRPLVGALLSVLQESAESEGAWLHWFEDEVEKSAIADLIVEADQQQLADNAFRQELAASI